MADLVTTIETELASVLSDIDGSTLASGYTFYNSVGAVNIDDECVVDDGAGYPALTVSREGSEEVLSGEQHAYRCSIDYEIKCELENDTDDLATLSPKRAIKKKMNEMLTDVKAVLSNNYQLNGSCDITSITGSDPIYLENGNSLRAGDLIVYVTIEYTQSRLNPNNYCTL